MCPLIGLQRSAPHIWPSTLGPLPRQTNRRPHAPNDSHARVHLRRQLMVSHVPLLFRHQAAFSAGPTSSIVTLDHMLSSGIDMPSLPPATWILPERESQRQCCRVDQPACMCGSTSDPQVFLDDGHVQSTFVRMKGHRRTVQSLLVPGGVVPPSVSGRPTAAGHDALAATIPLPAVTGRQARCEPQSGRRPW